MPGVGPPLEPCYCQTLWLRHSLPFLILIRALFLKAPAPQRSETHVAALFPTLSEVQRFVVI